MFFLSYLSFLSFFDYSMDFFFNKPPQSVLGGQQSSTAVLMLMQLEQRALSRILHTQNHLTSTDCSTSVHAPLECHTHPIDGAQTSSLLSTLRWIYKYWEALASLLEFTFSSYSWIQLDLHTGSVIFTKGRQPLFL